MSFRIGIVGSGFAKNHIKALNQIDVAEIVAICSRNEKHAKQITAGNQVNYYAFDNYLSMLKKEKLDAVYLCLPPFLYGGELELACSEYVKALFIEKPVALKLQLGRQMQETFSKAGTLVSVGYMNRYRDNIQRTKNYFLQDTPVLINTGWCDLLPPPYWWRQREQSGGQLTEQCTHLIDAIRYVAGEIDEVSAYTANGFINDIEDFNVDDALAMNFRLKSGAIGNAMASCFSRNHGGGSLGVFLNFASREKTYKLTSEDMNLDIQHTSDNTERFMSDNNPILEENRAFIEALKKNDSSSIQSSYMDALETLKVTLAADLSIKEKRTVRLSEL